MASDVVRNKAVVLLLLIYCLLLLPLFVGFVSDPYFVMQYLVSFQVLLSSRCGIERAGCFTIIVTLLLMVVNVAVGFLCLLRAVPVGCML